MALQVFKVQAQPWGSWNGLYVYLFSCCLTSLHPQETIAFPDRLEAPNGILKWCHTIRDCVIIAAYLVQYWYAYVLSLPVPIFCFIRCFMSVATRKGNSKDTPLCCVQSSMGFLLSLGKILGKLVKWRIITRLLKTWGLRLFFFFPLRVRNVECIL